jgi:signal transduction histidine kinase
MLARALDEARSLSRVLKTVPSRPDGLMSALDQLASGMSEQARCEFECTDPVFLSDRDAALALFTIAQEAVRNAACHSGASLIRVSLTRCDRGISLTVVDDGSGFTPVDAPGRISGIEIMRCQADSIGADFVIESGAGTGTTVRCELPGDFAPM